MVFNVVMTLSGGVCVLVSALVGSAAVERFLLGGADGSLRWGPTLFRSLLAFHGVSLVGFGLWRAHRPSMERDDISLGSPRTLEGSIASGRVWTTLAAISGVAVLLRLWKLDGCLWFDEIVTLVKIVREPLARIVSMFPSQNQHMFYSVLAHASVSALGETASALRLPSVVFGVASLWPLFFLGRRVIGTGLALVACAVVAVSYHHVWFSQNARGYMGLLFFTLLATWLWLEALDRGQARWWAGYSIAVALGSWTHMTMIFVVAAHGVTFLICMLPRLVRRTSVEPRSRRRDLTGPLVAWLFAATLTLQLYALVMPEFLASALHEVSRPSEWTNPLWVLTESVRNLAHVGPGGTVGVVVGAAVLLFAFLTLLRQSATTVLVMVLPGLLAGTTMVVLGHNLWPRFFFFCMGFAVLLAVHGVAELPRAVLSAAARTRASEARGRRIGLVLAGLMIPASAFMLPRCYALPKQDFLGARDYVERMRRPEEGVVAVGLAGRAYKEYYAPHWDVAQDRNELELLLASHANVWLVYTLPIQVRAYHPDIWELIARQFEVISVFPGTLGGGAVTVTRTK